MMGSPASAPVARHKRSATRQRRRSFCISSSRSELSRKSGSLLSRRAATRTKGMCGIIGYIGEREATQILIDGLARLEYRGYDSAGVAVYEGPERTRVARCRGKLGNLQALIRESPPRGK